MKPAMIAVLDDDSEALGLGVVDRGLRAVVQLPVRATVLILEPVAMSYSGVTAREPIVRHAADEGDYVLGFDDVLPAGATIVDVESSVEAIAGESLEALSVSDAQATSEEVETLWGDVVPEGRGVRVAIVGGTQACAYKVTLVVTCDEGSVRGGAFVVEVQG